MLGCWPLLSLTVPFFTFCSTPGWTDEKEQVFFPLASMGRSNPVLEPSSWLHLQNTKKLQISIMFKRCSQVERSSAWIFSCFFKLIFRVAWEPPCFLQKASWHDSKPFHIFLMCMFRHSNQIFGRSPPWFCGEFTQKNLSKL